MDVVRDYDFNGDGIISGGPYIAGGPMGNPFEDMGDSWTLWIYTALMHKINLANDPDASVTQVPIPEGGFQGMLDALRTALALSSVDIRALIRETPQTAAFYQLLLDFFAEYGLDIPVPPDDPRDDEDTIGYEELIKLLANYGEGGTNFQDLLQLLSDYGQPVPPPPPETGSEPRP